jgi:hypothetical protein
MSILENELYLDRIEIVNQFYHFFESKGLAPKSPEPIVPKNDKSVIFTGATINKFKDYIVNDTVVSPGYVSIQPCLRLFSLNKILYPEQEFHLSFFKMLGTLFHRDIQKESFIWCLDFLKNLGLDFSRLKIKASKQLSELLDNIDNTITIEFEKESDSFYQWKFGIDGIYGIGLTYSVWNETSKKWKDIGNYIQIFNEGNLICSEFAVGLESTQAHVRSLPHFLSATSIDSILSNFPGKSNWKIKEAISTIVVMYSDNLTNKAESLPPQSKQGALARKALKNLTILQHRFGISNSDLEFYINEMSLAEFGKPANPNIFWGLTWASEDIQKNTERFDGYLQELKKNINSGNISVSEAQKRALKKADGACSLPTFIRDEMVKLYIQ